MTQATAETEAFTLQGGTKVLIVPEAWHGSFTADDRASVTAIIQWLNDSAKTQAWLARLARVNQGTLNQVLRGSYTSTPSKFIAQAVEAMHLFDERRSKGSVPFVETSVAKLVKSAAHRARLYRNFSIVTGFVGTGKTEALKQLAAKTPNTYMVEADPDMGPGALLQVLVDQTRAEVESHGKYSKGSTAQKFQGLVKALDGTGALIVVDEAETMQPRSLHYLRRLRDKAGIGILLSGTIELARIIKPEHGQFDQIRSRVGFWPATVTSITREDADQVAQAAFAEVDLADDVLQALWDYGHGSVRVLVEDLIPGIRDYGLSKGRKLDTGLVKQIATQLLGLKPRKDAA